MPKLEPGDLIEYELDGYKFLGLVKTALPARRRGQPVLLEVDWCGLKPRLYPSNYIPEKYVRKVKDK